MRKIQYAIERKQSAITLAVLNEDFSQAAALGKDIELLRKLGDEDIDLEAYMKRKKKLLAKFVQQEEFEQCVLLKREIQLVEKLLPSPTPVRAKTKPRLPPRGKEIPPRRPARNSKLPPTGLSARVAKAAKSSGSRRSWDKQQKSRYTGYNGKVGRYNSSSEADDQVVDSCSSSDHEKHRSSHGQNTYHTNKIHKNTSNTIKLNNNGGLFGKNESGFTGVLSYLHRVMRVGHFDVDLFEESDIQGATAIYSDVMCADSVQLHEIILPAQPVHLISGLIKVHLVQLLKQNELLVPMNSYVSLLKALRKARAFPLSTDEIAQQVGENIRKTRIYLARDLMILLHFLHKLVSMGGGQAKNLAQHVGIDLWPPNRKKIKQSSNDKKTSIQLQNRMMENEEWLDLVELFISHFNVILGEQFEDLSKSMEEGYTTHSGWLHKDGGLFGKRRYRDELYYYKGPSMSDGSFVGYIPLEGASIKMVKSGFKLQTIKSHKDGKCYEFSAPKNVSSRRRKKYLKDWAQAITQNIKAVSKNSRPSKFQIMRNMSRRGHSEINYGNDDEYSYSDGEYSYSSRSGSDYSYDFI